jgi:predicted kinase
VLIVFAGPPCSGKSTLAAEVARRLRLPHLSMDATRARILPGAAHTRADRRVAYRAMHFAAELLLDADAGAVLDAPYGHDEDRDELAAIGEPRGVRYIECRVSAEEAARRFEQRGPDAGKPDLTAERVRRLARAYCYTNAGLALDTEALSREECLEMIEAWLGSGDRKFPWSGSPR